MSTKTLSLSAIIPRIKSETKSAARPTTNRRAVVVPRAKATTAVSRAVARSFVPAVSVVGVMAIVSMIGFHLFMVNAYAAKGFELKRHQAAITQLTEQQKQLVVREAEMGSIMKVHDVAVEYGLVPIVKEEFLNTKQLSQR